MAAVQYGLRLCPMAPALVVTSLTQTESKSKLYLDMVYKEMKVVVSLVSLPHRASET